MSTPPLSSLFRWIAAGMGASSVAAAPLPQADAQASPFFGLRAGVSAIQQVEAVLAAPIARRDAYHFEYHAAKGADDLAYVACEYFPEGQIARLDAYLKAPLPVSALRARFGQPVLRRVRGDGKTEELFFPTLNALIFSAEQPDQVIAIGYLAPRALADAYVDLANAAIRDKRNADAKEAADNAVIADPDYARGYLEQGILFNDSKDYNEAIVRFTAATHTRYTAHKQAQAHVWLGAVLGDAKNQPEQAQREFQAALRLGADYDLVLIMYANYLRRHKQDAQAEVEYKEALRLHPASSDAALGLAYIYAGRNAWAQAQPYLKQLAAWADTPAAAQQITQRAWIYSRYAYSVGQAQGNRNRFSNDQAQAQISIANYRKALQLAPGEAFASLNLGLEYDYEQDLQNAAKAYREGLVANPKHVEMNQNLADILLESNKYEEARRQAEAALALKSDDVWQMMNLARAYGALHKKPEAVAWVRKAVAGGYRTNPNSFQLEDGYFEGTLSDDELSALLEGRR